MMKHQSNSGNCTLASTNPDVLRCPLGDIPAGGTRQFDIWASIGPITGTTINRATVTSDTPDPNPPNNEAISRNQVHCVWPPSFCRNDPPVPTVAPPATPAGSPMPTRTATPSPG